jgi:hypothetical protein
MPVRPDGVTAADRPQPGREIDTRRSWAQVDAESFRGAVTFADRELSTQFEGTCRKDPSRQCSKASDCGESGPCLSGDEFWAQAIVMVASNQDNSPPCEIDCMGVNPDDGTCLIGRCIGGRRDGQVCGVPPMNVFVGTCPGIGATCSAANRSVPSRPDPATSDVVHLALDLDQCGHPDVTVAFNCPLLYAFAAPFDVRNGVGRWRSSLKIRGAFVPPTVSIELLNVFVHDNGAGSGSTSPVLSQVLPVGIYLSAPPDPSGTVSSAFNFPCPNLTIPVSECAMVNLLQIDVPVSPVIAAGGFLGGKIECTKDAECARDQCCCGGICVPYGDCPDWVP